jgi:hypothetical protein
MKGSSIHWWAGVIFLIFNGFSPVSGSLFADPPTIFLLGLTATGMLVCEFSMRGRRRRRRPALAVVVGHSRN